MQLEKLDISSKATTVRYVKVKERGKKVSNFYVVHEWLNKEGV